MKDKAQSIWRNAMKSTVPRAVFHVFLPLIFLGEIAHGDAYPFSKEDMDTLSVIQSVHLPSGKPVYKEPAIRVFAEQRNIQDVDLALGIVAFAKEMESVGEINLAGRALGHVVDITAAMGYHAACFTRGDVFCPAPPPFPSTPRTTTRLSGKPTHPAAEAFSRWFRRRSRAASTAFRASPASMNGI